ILGTPNSAGFGIVGLVGPLAAINTPGATNAIFGVIMAFFVIPFVGAFIIEWFCRKVIHLYDENIFKYI
ncbi:MAG: PTS sugar transporter subunit IIC, partial [Clostridium perfringens]|nr:PTS sugar transporter subunit IIC [Clostridium perfringens]